MITMTAATSKRDLVGNQKTRQVSPGVKTMVPTVLIEYLWDLAAAKDRHNGQIQWFTLQTGLLGGRKLQHIHHLAQKNGAVETHRVFGTEPVDCMLQVLSIQGGYEMRLCGEGVAWVSQRNII